MLQSNIDADLPKNREDMQRPELPSDVARMRAAIYLTYKLEDYYNQMCGHVHSLLCVSHS